MKVTIQNKVYFGKPSDSRFWVACSLTACACEQLAVQYSKTGNAEKAGNATSLRKTRDDDDDDKRQKLPLKRKRLAPFLLHTHTLSLSFSVECFVFSFAPRSFSRVSIRPVFSSFFLLLLSSFPFFKRMEGNAPCSCTRSL